MSVAEISLDRFVGTRVRLWPYIRGSYRRDLLYQLWALVEQHGGASRLFWGLHEPPERHGDLAHFVDYFDEAKGRVLVLVQSLERDELAGFLWLDDIIPKFRGFGNLFIVPAYRGAAASEAGRLFCDYCFTAMQMQAIWGATPWREALMFTSALGFQRVATLPAFVVMGEQPRPVYITRLTKEQFYGIDFSQG